MEPETQDPIADSNAQQETTTDQPAETAAPDALVLVTAERDQLKDQLLRQMADFQNFRKRSQDEVSKIRAYATENLIADLLPVLDNFERSLGSLAKGASVDSVLEGIRMVEGQLRSVLSQQQVHKIPSIGLPFNPEHHEAIAVLPSEEHEDETVVEELEAGYQMAGKVIRPARVKVARKS